MTSSISKAPTFLAIHLLFLGFLSNFTDATLELRHIDLTSPPSLLVARGLPTGTCNDQTPCVNGACCSKVGRSYGSCTIWGYLLIDVLVRSPAFVATPQVNVVQETVHRIVMLKHNAANTVLQGSSIVLSMSVAHSLGKIMEATS